MPKIFCTFKVLEFYKWYVFSHVLFALRDPLIDPVKIKYNMTNKKVKY